MWKSTTWFCGSLAILTMTAAAVAFNTTEYSGSIKSVDSKRIVLTTKGNDETFQINASTTILLNDKPAQATDLSAGDSAQVTAKGGVATSIDAERASNPKKPDPPK